MRQAAGTLPYSARDSARHMAPFEFLDNAGTVNASAMTRNREAVISTAATNANMRILFIGVFSIWDLVLRNLLRAQRVRISR